MEGLGMDWIKDNFVLIYVVCMVALVLGSMPLGYLVGEWHPKLHPLFTTPMLAVCVLGVLSGSYPNIKFRVTGER